MRMWCSAVTRTTSQWWVFAIHNYPSGWEFPRHLNSLHPVKYSGAAEKRTYYLPLNIARPASPSPSSYLLR